MAILHWTSYLAVLIISFKSSNTLVSAQPEPSASPEPLNFNHTFAEGLGRNTVLWGKRLVRNLTIYDGEPGGVVSWTVTDPSVLVLPAQFNTTFHIDQDTIFPLNVMIILGGRYPGRQHLVVTYTPPGAMPTEAGRHEVSCIVGQGRLNDIATYIFIIWLIISYVTMGCKMNIKVIYSKLKPPSGIIIGMFCQFLIMPALAYAIAKAFALQRELAVGLILVGTCPGGWISNVLTVLFDCDFVLSLTMTAFSTVIAMGMMPLNLFIYVETIIGVGENLQTPFVELVVQLIMLVVPLGVGVLLAWKWPVLEQKAEKLMKPFATILVLVAVGLGIPTQIYIFFVSTEGWITSLLLPFFGAFLGLSISRIIAQDYKTSTTIAFETACQNALLAKTMATLFYPKPESDLIGILPLLVAVLTAVEGLFAAIIYTIVIKIRDKRRQKQETAEDRVKMTSYEKTTNGDANKEKEAEAEEGNSNPAYSA